MSEDELPFSHIHCTLSVFRSLLLSLSAATEQQQQPRRVINIHLSFIYAHCGFDKSLNGRETEDYVPTYLLIDIWNKFRICLTNKDTNLI